MLTVVVNMMEELIRKQELLMQHQLFFNVTSVGNPESRAITFRDNAGGYYHNSIFVGYEKGIDIEYLKGQDQDTYVQFDNGNLEVGKQCFQQHWSW